MPNCVRLGVAAAAVLSFVGTGLADERLIVENFDDPLTPFNVRCTHEFSEFAGVGPAWSVRTSFEPGPTPLPSAALNLRGADLITWNTDGLGSSVFRAGASVWNHDPAAAATVTFHGTFAEATFEAPPSSAGYVVFEVTNDTLGVRPFPETGEASLGPIETITLRSSGDADFDDIFVSVNHKHCPCDFNQDNGYDVFDLLSFLNQWFLLDDASDFNGDGEFDVFDLLDFLDCWFDPANSGLRFCP